MRALVLACLLLGACTSDPFTDSEAYPRLSPAGQQAYAAIRTPPYFSDSCGGFACITPPAVEGFRILIEEPEADAAFKALLVEGNLPGQLYGLAGLYYTDAARFEGYAARFRQSTAPVPVVSGCIMGRQPAREIAADIADGTVPRLLRGG